MFGSIFAGVQFVIFWEIFISRIFSIKEINSNFHHHLNVEFSCERNFNFKLKCEFLDSIQFNLIFTSYRAYIDFNVYSTWTIPQIVGCKNWIFFTNPQVHIYCKRSVDGSFFHVLQLQKLQSTCNVEQNLQHLNSL